MTDYISPVTEGELHVYVDGELPADRREAVERWLASHPEDAALVAAWRAQAEAIRARYGAVINEPIPDWLVLSRIMRARRSWGAVATRAAAVAPFMVGSGGAKALDRARRVGRCPTTRPVGAFTTGAIVPTSSTSARSAIRSRSRRRRITCYEQACSKRGGAHISTMGLNIVFRWRSSARMSRITLGLLARSTIEQAIHNDGVHHYIEP